MRSAAHHGEQGTFTIWALGLCLTLFLLGGISVDMWRAFDAHRRMGEIADAAARSGASEINVQQRQLYGTTQLDPDSARQESSRSIEDNASLQSVEITSANIDVNEERTEISVEVHSSFSFIFLGLLSGGEEIDIVARSRAQPFER